MKKIINLFIIFLFLGLLIANIFLCYSSIRLGAEISFFEEKIEKIHHENLNLEKELAKVSSLQYVKELASNLNLTKNAEPIYLEKIFYAFKNRQ